MPGICGNDKAQLSLVSNSKLRAIALSLLFEPRLMLGNSHVETRLAPGNGLNWSQLVSKSKFGESDHSQSGLKFNSPKKSWHLASLSPRNPKMEAVKPKPRRLLKT